MQYTAIFHGCKIDKFQLIFFDISLAMCLRITSTIYIAAMLQTKYVQRLQTDHILACSDGEIGIFS